MRFRRLTLAAALAAGALAAIGTTAAPAGATGGGSISGTVVDAAGTPVANVCVEAQNTSWQTAYASTAPDGTYHLDVPAAGSYTVAFGCYNDRWVRAYWPDAPERGMADWVAVAEGQAVTGIDGRMVLGGVVAGRITDSAGSPVANASVGVSTGRTGVYGQAGADGRYRIQGIPPGSYLVYGFAPTGGQVFWHGTDYANAEHMVIAAGRVYPGIDMTAPQTGAISGRVTDAAGAPLADVCVSAQTDVYGGSAGYATTAADGTYAMPYIVPGSYLVAFTSCNSSAQQDEFYDEATSRSAATPVTVTGGQTTSGIDAALDAGSAIEGAITGPDGQPYAGACVSASRDYREGGNYRSATSDAAGHYALTGLAPGDYTVYASPCTQPTDLLTQLYGAPPGDPRNDHATPVAVSAGSNTAGIDMQFSRGGAIEGTVTANGAALSGLCVYASAHGTAGWTEAYGSTDAAGHYSLKPLPPGDADVAFFGCGPQFQDLVSEWYHDAVNQADATPVAVTGGQTTAGVDEDLSPAGTISGTVLVAGGAPAQGACALAARQGGTPPPPEGGGLPRSDGGYGGSVDGAGHYTIRGLPTGDYHVRFFDCSGYGRYAAEFYADAADEASAQTVAVATAGQAVTGIDATLDRAAPAVSGVRADGGGPSDVVAIVGERLSGATTVRFGGVASPQVTRVSAGQVDAVVPGGALGSTVDVTVTTADGTSPAVAADRFSYDSRPFVSILTPAVGPLEGGRQVTVSGARLSGATSVRFGGHAAAFTVVDGSTITANLPAGDAMGAVAVTVTTAAGANEEGAVFTYDGSALPPSVTALSPSEGPAVGGTPVTITGSHFSGATSVHFGAVAASYGTLADDTITAIAPAGVAGTTVPVTVTTSAGTSADGPQYTYRGPALTSLSETHGPLAGGNALTISGQYLTNATEVRFGGGQAAFIVQSDSSIWASAPPGAAPGPVDVTVVTPGGTSNALSYTYDAPPPAPVVSSVSPARGSTAGGNTVTITGQHLAGAQYALFGGSYAGPITVVNDTTIQVPAPSHSSGLVNVSVASAGGTGTLPGAYRYIGAPVVTAVSPPSGSLVGGTLVTITGIDFIDVTGVRVLDNLTNSYVPSYQMESSTKIVFRTPPHVPGTVNFIVETPLGASTANTASRFNYAVL